ncbi:MAG: hypothetical protein HXS54_01445 [Theionarchaea archaeon]|nr:hypothetical protein [Theionarchaea archaeon]
MEIITHKEFRKRIEEIRKIEDFKERYDEFDKLWYNSFIVANQEQNPRIIWETEHYVRIGYKCNFLDGDFQECLYTVPKEDIKIENSRIIAIRAYHIAFFPIRKLVFEEVD